jgi:flagellar basal body-associated protein FliL
MDIKIIIVLVVIALLAGSGVTYFVIGGDGGAENASITKPAKQERKPIPIDDGARF